MFAAFGWPPLVEIQMQLAAIAMATRLIFGTLTCLIWDEFKVREQARRLRVSQVAQAYNRSIRGGSYA